MSQKTEQISDMNAKFRMDKFKGDSGDFMQIRHEVLLSRKIIAFGIAGTDLSTMQFASSVDFDKESDALIEKNKDSQNNLAFEYIPGFGFDEVGVNEQSWFHF